MVTLVDGLPYQVLLSPKLAEYIDKNGGSNYLARLAYRDWMENGMSQGDDDDTEAEPPQQPEKEGDDDEDWDVPTEIVPPKGDVKLFDFAIRKVGEGLNF